MAAHRSATPLLLLILHLPQTASLLLLTRQTATAMTTVTIMDMATDMITDMTTAQQQHKPTI